MNIVQVQLPTAPKPLTATLLYEHDYSSGNHHLDFPHLIRQGLKLIAGMSHGDALEEAYWSTLDKFRNDFADVCSPSIGQIDLLIDPPSTRGYHRPFVSAFKQRYPNTHWLAFKKTKPVSADIDNMDELRAVVEMDTDRTHGKFTRVNPLDLKKVLIIDDVYATGVTAAVIIEKLLARKMPDTVDIFIAAPLRIPTSMMKNKSEKITDADVPK